MTVARLDREMSSAEFTQWSSYYEILDAAKAGKLDSGEHHERGDEEEADGK